MSSLGVGPPRGFLGYAPQQARLFAAAWLPAWTGNDPERLASFYTEDTFYSDPQVPDELEGRDALLAHLRRLLARYPDWVWTQTASSPVQDGFVNFWHAHVPVSGSNLEIPGVCHVVLRDGLIARNTVFFDRLEYIDHVDAILAEPIEIRDGCVEPPDRPGNGIEWNERAIDRMAA
jgi:SnoaL-like protein